MPDTVTALAELGAMRSTLTPAQSDQLDQLLPAAARIFR